MCLGAPMRILSVDGLGAVCEGADGLAQVSLALTGPVGAGEHVLVYLGSAMRVLDADEARRIGDALEAMARAARGERFEHLIQDLADREPELPPHLRDQKSTTADRENADGTGDY